MTIDFTKQYIIPLQPAGYTAQRVTEVIKVPTSPVICNIKVANRDSKPNGCCFIAAIPTTQPENYEKHIFQKDYFEYLLDVGYITEYKERTANDGDNS